MKNRTNNIHPSQLKVFLFCISLIYTSTSSGQGILDSIYPDMVRIHELEFADSAEQRLFEADFDSINATQMFAALMNTNEPVHNGEQKEWTTVLSRLRQMKIPKKRSKYIKEIYHEVHGALLKKYDAEVSFDMIFSNGEYNCVTASALYALAFEELNIPYELKELPSHVYIIAYPSEQIVVESTDPQSGLYEIDYNFKTEFINNLVADKIISSSELSASTVSELFNEHYFKDLTINFKQLLGIQYYNQGVIALLEKQYQDAAQQLEKGCYLYPSGACIANLVISMANIIDRTDYSSSKDIMFLARLSRIGEDFGMSQELIIDEFARATNMILIEKGEKQQYDQFYEQLTSHILENDSLTSEMSHIYNYESARYHLLKGNQEESLPYAIAALKSYPNNLQNQAMVISTYQNRFAEQHSTSEVDSVMIKEYFELRNLIPSLWSNGNYKSLYVNLSTAMIAFEVENNRFKSALKSLEDVVSLANEIEILPAQQLVSFISGEIAKHYFKKGQYKSAREATGLGLSVYPNDPFLKSINRQLH